MRQRARTDLCGGRPVMVVPTATIDRQPRHDAHTRIHPRPRLYELRSAVLLVLRVRRGGRSACHARILELWSEPGLSASLVLLSMSKSLLLEVHPRVKGESARSGRGRDLTERGGIDVRRRIREVRMIQHIHHIHRKFEFLAFGNPHTFDGIHIESNTFGP